MLALNHFYQASVALTLTLHLDPTVTLVPGPRRIDQTTLVRRGHPDRRAAGHRRPAPAGPGGRARACSAPPRPTRAKPSGAASARGIQAGYTVRRHQDLRPRQGLRPLRPAEGRRRRQPRPGALHLRPGQDGHRQRAVGGDRRGSGSPTGCAAAVVSAQQNSIANAKLIPVARRQLDAAQAALEPGADQPPGRHHAHDRRAPGPGTKPTRPACATSTRSSTTTSRK